LEKIYLIVIGMALVTYLPRVLPIIFLQNLKLPKKLQRFLSFIPYTILGALIFPGILSSTGNTLSALIGSFTAIILAWNGLNILFIVIGSVLVTTLIQLI
jgi:branched-subunit amino acid transport protein